MMKPVISVVLKIFKLFLVHKVVYHQNISRVFLGLKTKKRDGGWKGGARPRGELRIRIAIRRGEADGAR